MPSSATLSNTPSASSASLPSACARKLAQLNAASSAEFIAQLSTIYEHSPWVAEKVVSLRPFDSLVSLKYAMQRAVMLAGSEAQLALIRAHPELAGKAAMAGELGAESTGEQALVGLNLCSAEEFATLHRLNHDYNAKFGFPFILAVKGDHGRGLTRQEIIASFERRLQLQPDVEMLECLRQIGRIAEMRLNALFENQYEFGLWIMDRAEELARYSDDEGMLTCAWLTPAHRTCAALLKTWMQEAGMEVTIDAVGNVVGRYRGAAAGAKTLITGSHFDTVRNGGKYDGRLGVLLPIAVLQALHARGERLPFDVEVVAFADEEGVRYQSTFLGSKALIGEFDLSLLEKTDGQGISMRQALQDAGLDAAAIPAIARKADQVLGFVEVHIEQGPVLLQQDLAVGVVTAIAGCSRYLLHLEGQAGHAGTTPMAMRRDAACAAAEIILMIEARCQQAGLVGTVGQLQVPGGSVNVIPGGCTLSLDIRSGDDALRRHAVEEIFEAVRTICARRRIHFHHQPLLEQAAASCAPSLMRGFEQAIARLALPVLQLPSGVGHDAMCVAKLTDIAMLFVRCGNGGISHNPLESLNADDAEIAAQVFLDFLRHFEFNKDESV
ncbi:MAG: allantoate amidohydrolase [Burkholderiales bacterium]|nr:allantoate amidohydrolase [Burkholderiales bacterium]